MIDQLTALHHRPSWAVIDIGSNSVRLVMYEGPARCPIVVFNEKTLCGLGQTDPDTGRLRDEATEEALETLRRFRRILDAVDVASLHVIATAAVRDAPNGQDFLAEVEEIGFSPILLSGEEEAKNAAYGILSGAPDILDAPEGALAGDIGGGSLELSHIADDAPEWIRNKVSLPLGALRLSVQFPDDRAAARAHIEKEVARVPWLSAYQGKELHVVGGAWRGLARIAILNSEYPIEILDQYELTRDDVLRICGFVATQSIESLISIPVVQRRRAITLPYAAMVLEIVIKAANIKKVRVASSGLREGVLFAQLPPETRRQDPLIAVADHIAIRFGSLLRPSADALTSILDDLFTERMEVVKRWRHAAAILCNFSNGLQPDERAIHSAMTIMGLPLKGIGHPGRVYLSAALAVRHGASSEDLDDWLPMGILNRRQRKDVVILGLALRLLTTLSPGGGPALEGTRVEVSRGRLRLVLPKEFRDIWGATPAKRFDRLAAAMGLEGEVAL